MQKAQKQSSSQNFISGLGALVRHETGYELAYFSLTSLLGACAC